MPTIYYQNRKKIQNAIKSARNKAILNFIWKFNIFRIKIQNELFAKRFKFLSFFEIKASKKKNKLLTSLKVRKR